MFLSRRSCLGIAAGLCAGAVALTGCGARPARDAGETSGSLHVVAAFYPLQFATEQVAGRHASVTNLTQPGAEPHDLELHPRDVAALDEADLVVYLRGFQPAVDDAVAQTGDDALDVSPHADLTVSSAQDPDDDAREEADGSRRDPHFWLDPLRLATVGDGIADRLAEIDPAHARDYRDNAAALRSKLRALDTDFRTGLAGCQNRDLVTSHEAFGYLAARYGFDQVGIAGLSPEQEPSAADLSKLSTYARDHEVRTIYYERLVSPTIADTLAREVGARAAVLDPLEGLTDASAGSDYLSVMRTNLATLEKGQNC